MKIVRARISGFCMGVRRAVDLALEAVSSGEDVYSLGPLVHNSRVLSGLKNKGLKILDEDEMPPAQSAVIIRAHGIPPEAEKKLTGQGLRILDATCPHVKKNQEKAGHYAGRGYRIFLAGEKNHSEIKGIYGYIKTALLSGPASAPASGPTSAPVPGPASAPELSQEEYSCFIVGNAKEAEEAAQELFSFDKEAGTVLIGQTTISQKEYSSIGDSIRRFFPDLEIVDTICTATANRQQALAELCGMTDAVIIAGSAESSNTGRLLSLAREMGVPCWLAENAEDIPAEICKYQTVGIAAGASAPEILMDEIEEALKKY